jgi:hypothetical protein
MSSKELCSHMRVLMVLSIIFTLVPFTPLHIITSSSPSTETVEIYLYTVIIETDSDWTTIEFSSGATVIGYNYTLIQGVGTPGLTYVVEPTFISISKKPYDQTPVSINVSVAAIKGDEVGLITVRKGDIGSTKVSMYAWMSGGYMLIWSVTNDGTNPQYPGTNDRSFTLSFKQLYEHPVGLGVYEDLVEEFSERVLAFYYPWYGVAHGASGRWFHWEGVTENSIANTAHYPLLGIYDSWDERLIEAHILLAKHAGIDGFIVSWWGPSSFEDQSLKRIIGVAEKYNFKITIYYESYRTWNPLVSPTDIIDELSYVVGEYSGSRAFLKIDGKPVIFIYSVEAHNRGPSFWLQVRKSLENKVGPVYLIADLRNPSYLNVFDGFHTYIELNSSTMRELYSFYSTRIKIGLAGLNFSEAIAKIQAGDKVVVQRKALLYTVTPGFDNRKISEPGIYVDRDGGLLYQKMWSDALELGAKHVLITSWNELHEGTEIEPTREYGFKYLEMTRNYASELKQISIEEVRPPNLSLITFSDESRSELHLGFFNKGGPAIAVRVEMILPPEVTAHITGTYRQPSEPSVEVAVIPLIRSGEEYWLTVKIGNVSGGELNVARLNIQYYSLNGSPYNTTGVEGYVRDENGKPVGGVNVIALSKIISTGKVSETKTDGMGHYFMEIPPGEYVLVFSAIGYADTSTNVSLSLGEVKRVDISLKQAKAEFSEDWSGVKFEVALITKEPWKVGDEANVEVWITVSDMGRNQRVQFKQLKLWLLGTSVEKTVPLNVETDIGGTVYRGNVSLKVLDGFELMEPESSKSYSLELSLEGSFTDNLGITWSRVEAESTSMKVYTPPSPVNLSVELPAKVIVGEEFDVKVKIKNGGEYPINNVKVELLLPFGTSAIGPLDWSKSTISQGEEAAATFRLKADLATTATVDVSLSYETLWGYLVPEFGKTLGSVTISRVPTSISISVEPSQVTVGENVIVKGTITPAISTPITLTVKDPDGVTSTLYTTSSPDGTFRFTVTLNKEGRYSFVASFGGGIKYEVSTSSEAYAEAKPTPVPLWLYATAIVCAITIIAVVAIRFKRRRSATSKP